MVNVLKGVLIECDPAMKQFLLYLDESNALGKKFIIQDIDDTHVFVIAELVNVLQERACLSQCLICLRHLSPNTFYINVKQRKFFLESQSLKGTEKTVLDSDCNECELKENLH
uniref:General transcription and DNA repair factor IIH subunit TFB5 n=1 Tax=Equus asinus TaxID=9793 RepID=A0A9L0IMP4_EQUAS